MDLLNILINPINSNFCCLCFKQSEEFTNLNDSIEIHDECFAIKTNLGSIMKNLFSSFDILLTQACEECSNLVLKIFCLIKRNHLKNEMLQFVLDNLNDEIDCKLIDNIKRKTCRLNIKQPSFEELTICKKTIKEVACTKCQMKFKSESVLRKHNDFAHKNTNNAIICDICGKIFTNSAKLKAHLGCHLKKECLYCFKSFKSNSHFKLHLKTHESQKRHTIKRNIKYLKCNKCNYQTVNKSTLEAHVNKVHLNFRPYKCQICQKGFYKNDNLSQHLLTHKKEKENICYVCGEGFVIERTLQEHLKLHSGQKSYTCDICNISFITSGRRYEHIKRKHMEKNEYCIICDKKFSLKKDLNSHIKNVHDVQH